MSSTVKVRKIGNSLGIVLTKDVLNALGLGEGDELHLVQTSEGIKLLPYDPLFAEAMAAFERARRKYRNALRELGND